MRSVLLIGNKEERFLIRSLMKDLGDIIAPASFEEALQMFKHQPQPVLTAIIDERFEMRFASQSVAQATTDISRSQMTCAEFIEEIKKLGVLQPQTQYAVILADDRDSSHTLLYSEMGADMVLARPMGSNDIKSRFESFFQLVRNPPASVRMVKFLRGLVESKKYNDAFNALTKFLALDPQNPHGQLLYAKTLLNLGPEKVLQGIEQLKVLDTKFANSILVKKLLRDSFTTKEMFFEAHQCSERIYEIESSRVHFSELLDTAKKLFSRKINEQVFYLWITKFLAHGIPQKRRELALLYERWFDSITEDFSFERLMTLMESLNKIFPPKYFDETEIKKGMAIYFTRLFDVSVKHQSTIEDLPEDQQKAFISLINHLLDVDPQNGPVLMRYVELAKAKKELRKHVWTRLETSLGGVGSVSSLGNTNSKSATGRKGPIESYIGVAILGLLDGLLKEASDAIYAGKRIAPNDPRLEVLSAEWRKAYDAKQST